MESQSVNPLWLNGTRINAQPNGAHQILPGKPLTVTEIVAPPGFAIDAIALERGVVAFVDRRTPAEDVNRYVPQPGDITI